LPFITRPSRTLLRTRYDAVGDGKCSGLERSLKSGAISMNLPGHRIVPSLRKAALKTHALQTLTRDPLIRPRARSVWSASDLSALSVWRGTASGSWFQYVRKNERGSP